MTNQCLLPLWQLHLCVVLHFSFDQDQVLKILSGHLAPFLFGTSHGLGGFFCFLLLATWLVICAIGQVGAIGVFSRPGRDHLDLLCRGSLASPTYQTYSRLTTQPNPLPPNSHPHSYCVPHHHCPYSSQSGAGR